MSNHCLSVDWEAFALFVSTLTNTFLVGFGILYLWKKVIGA